MRKATYLILGMITLIGLIIAGIGLNAISETHQGLEDIQADFILGPGELFSSFEENENQANERYLGKVLEIEGTIASIEELSKDKVNVLIQVSEDAFGGINCSFAHLASSELVHLQKGNKLRIRGECTGFLMDVNLVRCIIIPL